VIHYLWLVKKDLTTPLVYGAVALMLLALRLQWGVSLLQAARSRFVAARV